MGPGELAGPLAVHVADGDHRRVGLAGAVQGPQGPGVGPADEAASDDGDAQVALDSS
jgi:hypothetical protein